MLNGALRWLRQTLCWHTETVRRTERIDGKVVRVFTECFDCGKSSKGWQL